MLGLPWRIALTGGLALSLSSTAMVMSELQERKLMDMPTGRAGFGILLFQDMAAIPLIALLPLLGPTVPVAAAEPGWLAALKALAMLGAIALVGRYLLNVVLRIITSTGVAEIFTAFALLWIDRDRTAHGERASVDVLGRLCRRRAARRFRLSP